MTIQFLLLYLLYRYYFEWRPIEKELITEKVTKRILKKPQTCRQSIRYYVPLKTAKNGFEHIHRHFFFMGVGILSDLIRKKRQKLSWMRGSEPCFITRKYYRVSRAPNSCSPALSPVCIRIMGCKTRSYISDFGQG